MGGARSEQPQGEQRADEAHPEGGRELLSAPEIVDKPKIGFFNRSLDAWLERQATPLVDVHLSDSSAKVRDIVDLDTVRRFAHGGPGERRVAFRVLMLELWLEQNTGVSQPYAGAALGGTS